MSKEMANNLLTITLPEALTIFQVSDTYKALKELDLSQSIELDFSQVEEIDGAGIQLLVALETHLKQHNAMLALKHVSEGIEEAFALFNLPYYENQVASA